MNLEKTIKPQGVQILVMPVEEGSKTASGLVVKTDKPTGKAPKIGEIIDISRYMNRVFENFKTVEQMGSAFISPEFKITILCKGDIVIFAEYAGDDIEVKDLDTDKMVKLKLIPAENILGTISSTPQKHASKEDSKK